MTIFNKRHLNFVLGLLGLGVALFVICDAIPQNGTVRLIPINQNMPFEAFLMSNTTHAKIEITGAKELSVPPGDYKIRVQSVFLPEGGASIDVSVLDSTRSERRIRELPVLGCLQLSFSGIAEEPLLDKADFELRGADETIIKIPEGLTAYVPPGVYTVLLDNQSLGDCPIRAGETTYCSIPIVQYRSFVALQQESTRLREAQEKRVENLVSSNNARKLTLNDLRSQIADTNKQINDAELSIRSNDSAALRMEECLSRFIAVYQGVRHFEIDGKSFDEIRSKIGR